MAFVQQVYSVNKASTSSHDIVPTANTTVGNRLIMAFSVGSSRVITGVSDTQGNSWNIDSESGGARSSAILSCYLTTALTTGDTITVTLNAASAAFVAVAEFSGLESSALDKTNSNQAGSVTAGNTNSTGTLSQADELVVVTIAWSGGLGTVSSSPTGYTALTSPSSIFTPLYKDVSATTALDESWAWTTARNYGACITTYKYPIVSAFKPRVVFM